MSAPKLIARMATEDDVALVQEIANANMLSLNPLEDKLGEVEARELISGFVDQAATRFTKFEGDENWQSFLTLNPDFSRSRCYLDIYTRPGAETLPSTLMLALEIAKAGNPNFQLWLGVHSKDEAYRTLLVSNGFNLLRRYWMMQMKLESKPEPHKHVGQIREINLDNPKDLHSFYEVNQDSFSQHFGFMPRPFDEWSRIVLRDREEANLRVWLLSLEGEEVGFIDCDDSLVHEESGYVAGLGVRKAFHGKGLGEALLRHAIEINFGLGRSKLSLNVDTGNESGALRLYEKVGMKPFSEWHQYENVNWSALV